MLFLALSRLENALNQTLCRAGEMKLYFILLNLSMTVLSIYRCMLSKFGLEKFRKKSDCSLN